MPVSVTSNRTRALPVVLTEQPGAQRDLAGGGELHGVAGQVEEDLPDPGAVAAHQVGQPRVALGDELEALRVGGRRDQVGGLLDDVDDLDVADLELQAGALHAGEVEDVVDQVEQHPAGAVHALGVLPLPLVEVGLHQQLGEADDAVHRGADLVAHGRQELGLGAGGLERGVARGLEILLGALLGA